MSHPTWNHEGHIIVFDDDLRWSIEHPLECREGPVPMSECPTSEYMWHFTEPPVAAPGRYEVGVNGRTQMYELQPSDRTKPRSLVDRLAEHVSKNGAVVISYTQQEDTIGTFVVGSEWGSEAEDSPMAGAAAYGVDPEITRALRKLLDEAGVQ